MKTWVMVLALSLSTSGLAMRNQDLAEIPEEQADAQEEFGPATVERSLARMVKERKISPQHANITRSFLANLSPQQWECLKAKMALGGDDFKEAIMACYNSASGRVPASSGDAGASKRIMEKE